MDKTNIDDTLIEMITPKVQEIEEKFGRGEGLEQSDINILLLKSQYNHINHLDQKINEVAKSNALLRLDFADLKTELKTDFSNLKTDFADLKTDFADLKTDFANLKTDIQESINSTMKWYIGGAGVILILLKALDIFIYTPKP